MALLRDIQPNSIFEGTAVVKRVDLRKKKDGANYLSFIFSDKTGEVNANYWAPALDEWNRFSEGDVVKVKGKGRAWQGSTELEVEKVEKATPGAWAVEQFVETAERPPAESLKIIRERIAKVKRPALKTLLEGIAADPRLEKAPAAKAMHHHVIGGLAEHVATLLLLSDRVLECYPALDADLVIAGLMLHDIGKLEELEITTKVDYTTEGRLLGHIFEGARRVAERAAKIPDFPPDVLLRLLHIILSHHGELELGSPIVPMTTEAVVVHQIDDLDAKYWAYQHHIETQMGGDKGWTKFHRVLERFLYSDADKKEDAGHG